MYEEGERKKTFVFERENDFFQKINIELLLIQDNNYHNPRYCGGEYYNETRIADGKIEECKLSVQIKISKEGCFSNEILFSIIDHELNHMYDDWQWQSTGHEPLSLTQYLNRSEKFINDFIQSNDGILKTIAWCLYLSKWTEENSHVNQAYSEFSKIGLTRRNCAWKIKSTTSYRNYNKIKIDMEHYVGQNSENKLQLIAAWIKANYGDIGIPKKGNDNKYGERLLKWAENIFKRFIKRYCSIASLYLERQPRNI